MTPPGVEALLLVSKGDMRKIINTLQVGAPATPPLGSSPSLRACDALTCDLGVSGRMGRGGGGGEMDGPEVRSRKP